jgi:predicted CoA-binding protein
MRFAAIVLPAKTTPNADKSLTTQLIIAVVGASADRAKFGNKCVRAYHQAGWHVIPVHPSEQEIEGLKVYRSLAEAPPVHLDRVSVYLPSTVLLNLLDELAARPIGELWLNPGADAPHVAGKARQLGLNVICGCSIVAIGASPHELD